LRKKFGGDMTEEIRLKNLKNDYKDYYKNYLLLFTLGLIWLLSAFVAAFEIQVSIFLLFLGICLFKPALFLVTKILRTPKIHNDESLKLLTKLIVLGIVIGVIVGFFPFVENINLFFPTFTIIFGLIFACVGYSAQLKNYILLGVLMIAGGIYIGYFYPQEFTYGGYFSGIVMTGFGLINGIIGKKMQITLRYLRKRMKMNLNTFKPKISNTAVESKALKSALNKT
jgi:hypothetical protein